MGLVLANPTLYYRVKDSVGPIAGFILSNLPTNRQFFSVFRTKSIENMKDISFAVSEEKHTQSFTHASITTGTRQIKTVMTA